MSVRSASSDSKGNLSGHQPALLVIDMQNGFLCEGAPIEIPNGREIISPLKNLLEVCRRYRVPILFTKMYHTYGGLYYELKPHHYEDRERRAPYMREGTKWVEICDELIPQPGDIVVNKYRYSAFYGTELELVLREHNIDTVIISGVATSVCCDSTARDAFFRDFRVIFLADCTATFDKELHEVTLRTIGDLFGRVARSGDIIKELVSKR